jgi:hypothetical protein
LALSLSVAPVFSAIGQCPVDTTSFFPAGWLAEREPWYGKHLRAMQERPLCSGGSQRTAYRFLWLRTFHAPIAIRIEAGDKGHLLVAKRLTGQGGYDPGSIDLERTVPVSADDWDRLSLLVANAGFWSEPTQEARDCPDGNVCVHFDGAQWVLEGFSHGHYHAVDRWSPTTEGPFSAYREACLYLVQLAGLDVEPLY